MLWVFAFVMVLAAVRTLRTPEHRRDPSELRREAHEAHDAVAAARGSDGTEASLRRVGPWLSANAALSSIILSGAVVAVLADVFVSLESVFVRDTLDTDPANSLYVFASGIVGIVLALVPAASWCAGPVSAS